MKSICLSVISFFCLLSVCLGVESLPIRSGETVSGTIESASANDKWQFYGETGERVIIYAFKTAGSMSGAYLKLYDTAEAVEDQNRGSSGIDRQLKKTGLYEISVEAVDKSGTGDYSLTFQKIPGTVSAPGDLDGGTVIPGIKYSGAIDDISDFDAYQFYGQAGDIARVYALKKSGDMTGMYIKLYPGDGKESESGNSGLFGINHQLKKTGLYTIIVEADDHSGTGNYEMALIKDPAAIRPGIYNQDPENGDLILDDDGSFSWYPLSGATGYDVYFGKGVSESLKRIGSNIAFPYLSFPGMDSGDVYCWQVVAHTPSGDVKGPYFWFEYRKDTTPPSDGTISAAPGSGQVSLSWSGFSDTESGINNYKLVFDTGGVPVSCSDGKTAYSGTNKSYLHKGLVNSTTYYYRLCAKDKAGNMSNGITASAMPSILSAADLTGEWKSLVQACKPSAKGPKCVIKGKISIMNNGQQESRASVVKFYLSDNGVIEGTDKLFKKVSTGKIKAGKSRDTSISYSLLTGTSASGKYVIAQIDANNSVVEADESNNNIDFGPLP
jgi:hypothetical protein